ncbi:MAG: hypothetical protein EZS28_004141 [Streblomastix strix]|uniref:VWFA domain-containing protein n=1 Tax=Streblomastix strix TaxID=222440 RepID=A0A5J4X0K7_9EUKA|nr:MAG: hypothetical protein EZS28_004141 [Streblomastix strix]
MMRQGGWVLLDGVESAPHEVERLMSLLEEEPTLAIYEGVRPLIFHGRGVVRDNSGENEISQQFKDGEVNLSEEKVEIAEGFQIFITKSHAKELAESVLFQSDTGRLYSVPIARMLAGVFFEGKTKSKTQNLLFSKDTFSPHRIVNAARGIGQDEITAESIASGVAMSFVQCFKSEEDQHIISTNAEGILAKIADEKLPSNTNKWEEFNKHAGQLEYVILFDFIQKKGKDWPTDAEEELNLLFKKHYMKNDRMKNIHKFDKDITIPELDEMIQKFEHITLEWIKDMKFSDIRKTVSVLSEVNFIVTSFCGIGTTIASRFYRIHHLLESLNPASELSGLNVSQGEKLYQKTKKMNQLQLLVISLDQIIKLKWQGTKFEKETEIAAQFYRKRCEPLKDADPSKIQNSIDQLSVFNQKIAQRKDIGNNNGNIPILIKDYYEDFRYDEAVTALINFSRRQEAISKASENASFENIVFMLAQFCIMSNVDNIVNPFYHLLENAKEGSKLKKEDIEKLKQLSRAHLLCRNLQKNQNSIIKLPDVLQALIDGDERIVNKLQHTPNCVEFIQFPTFIPSDLIACIQITTQSGIFYGPIGFNQDNIKQVINYEPKDKKEALLICAELLVGKEFQNLIKELDISSWQMKIGQLERKKGFQFMLMVSEDIDNRNLDMIYLLDPDSDQDQIKNSLRDHPCEGIIHDMYSSEYKIALSVQNEWEKNRRLSVLHILLFALTMKEEISKQDYQINSQNWEERIRSMILQLDRRNTPYGYRIANLLGCVLIEDLEAQIARSIINNVLHQSVNYRRIFENQGLDVTILLCLKEYVQRLLIEEHEKEFNALIQGDNDSLQFLSSSILADFGVHIDRSSTSNSGIVTIENLSSSNISVDLITQEEQKLKAKLVSNAIKAGQRIEIQFHITGPSSEEPIMAWASYEIIAKSTREIKQPARCQVRAWVRRVPLCCIIESSSSLVLGNNSQCTLAPKTFTEIVSLTNHIPTTQLSSKAIGWSLSSESGNMAEAPNIEINKEKQELTMKFETETTGLCTGKMIVGLGHAELYQLQLSVPVSRITSIGVFHPANPDSTFISLTQCNSTHIVVYNKGNLKKNLTLQSSNSSDTFEPQSLNIDPLSQALVKVNFIRGDRRTISVGKAKLQIILIKNKITFNDKDDYTRISMEQDGYFPCILINNKDGTSNFNYTKKDQYLKRNCPSFILQNQTYIPDYTPPFEQNPIHLNRWVLDPDQGLRFVNAEDQISSDTIVLWAEKGQQQEYIRTIDLGLDKHVKDAMKKVSEASNLTNQSTSQIPKLIVDATNFFFKIFNRIDQINYQSLINCANKGKAEKNADALFCKIILALDKEVKRNAKVSILDIITQIARIATKRKDWTSSIPSIPTTWKDQGQQLELKKLTLHLIWGSIILLHTLCNPRNLTDEEISNFKEMLIQGPQNEEINPKQRQIENASNIQSVFGQEVQRIGVIYGRFIKAEIIDEILKKVEQMNIPIFPPISKDKENDQPISIAGLLKQVEQQFELTINQFQTSKNPSDLNRLLIIIPSLTKQAIIAIQHIGNQNISKLVANLGTLTIIIQELQRSIENMLLLEENIKKAAEGCYQTWANLLKVKVQPPQQLKISQTKLNELFNSDQYTQNVEIVPIQECTLRRGVWQTQAEQISQNQGRRNQLRFGDMNMRAMVNKGMSNDDEDSKQDSNDGIYTSPVLLSSRSTHQSAQQSEPMKIIPIKKNNSELPIDKILVAMRDAYVEKPPPEELNEGEEYQQIAVNPNEIQSRLIQANIVEMLEGKKVEDLLIIEYNAVKRAPRGKDNQIKLSEGRNIAFIDGTLDRHDFDSIEGRSEIIELHALSLQIQSLLYAEISRMIIPFDQNKTIPFTIKDTEVSLIVDVSASMTKLAKAKQMGSMVLIAGISDVLASFGIPLQFFAFADREAIWKLSDSTRPNHLQDMIRVIDALRTGGRPGSFPLDAAITGYQEWDKRLKSIEGAIKGATNHLTIIISDFISAQVLDRDRDWSKEDIGQCILISLNTEFNMNHLEDKKIPKEVYDNGLIPNFVIGGNITSFRINPMELCMGFSPPENSTLLSIMKKISLLLKTNSKAPTKGTSTNLKTCSPIHDQAMFWTNLGHTHEIATKTGNDFFVQMKSLQNFALMTINTSPYSAVVRVPENIETDRGWLERQSATIAQTPFGGFSHDVATMALTHSLAPNRAAGKEPSPSSGQLWIPGLRRFIASGFTYPNLFLKKSRQNQKAYSITFVIDNTLRIFSAANISHTVSTIAALIGSIALVPEGDDIVVDVIIACQQQIQLLVYNFPAKQLSDGSLISDIFRTMHKHAGEESGIGSGLNAALQIASRRSGVGFGRRVIALTDSIVTNITEINCLRQSLLDCDASGIDVVGVGLGIAPLQLPQLFPTAFYAQYPTELGNAMAAALSVSRLGSNGEITAQQLFSEVDVQREQQLEILLCGDPSQCPQLSKSIRERELSQDFMEAIGNTDLLFMKGSAIGLTQNPEEKPYYENSFQGFRMLIVCLYLGQYEADPSKFKQKSFDDQCGKVLHKKGFEYTFVSSYGEGLAELQLVENGRCPYSQLWLFSTNGKGVLPQEAKDKDTNKIVPFMQAVADFWLGGGGLFLFCDNTPFTFEANYLLEKHLNFSHAGRNGPSAVQLHGNYYGTKQIHEAPSDMAACGSFYRQSRLEAPGIAKTRISLRPGLVHFSEGITISSACNSQSQPLTDPAQLWPFTPFGWTSENVSPPRPFILYFDPKIPPESSAAYDSEACTKAKPSPGPIVLHGGFTSAFSEFDQDEKGMGRLVVSIACWLTRIEERMYAAKRSGTPLLYTTPALKGTYTVQGKRQNASSMDFFGGTACLSADAGLEVRGYSCIEGDKTCIGTAALNPDRVISC